MHSDRYENDYNTESPVPTPALRKVHVRKLKATGEDRPEFNTDCICWAMCESYNSKTATNSSELFSFKFILILLCKNLIYSFKFDLFLILGFSDCTIKTDITNINNFTSHFVCVCFCFVFYWRLLIHDGVFKLQLRASLSVVFNSFLVSPLVIIILIGLYICVDISVIRKQGDSGSTWRL